MIMSPTYAYDLDITYIQQTVPQSNQFIACEPRRFMETTVFQFLAKSRLKKNLSVMDSLPAELAELGQVVQRVNDPIHWINRYPVDIGIGETDYDYIRLFTS